MTAIRRVVNFADRFEKFAHLPRLQQLQAVDLETYLPGDILVKVDRASMAYSLEARCPWLDYRMGELAGSLPAHFLLKNGRGKHIFKEMVAPHIPEADHHPAQNGLRGPDGRLDAHQLEACVRNARATAGLLAGTWTWAR